MAFKNTRPKRGERSKGELVAIRNVAELPTGHNWLPAAIVAYHFKVSTQTIRNLFNSGQIRGFKFPVGPTLYSAEEVELVSST